MGHTKVHWSHDVKFIILFYFCQATSHLAVQVETVCEDRPEPQITETTEPTEEEQPVEQIQKQEQVQKILANIRQNFGRINVAPEFSEEDLVPVQLSDIDDSCASDEEEQEDEEGSEEEEEDEQRKIEPNETQKEESEVEDNVKEEEKLSPDGQSDRPGAKSSREVNKELDEKISKLKHFLDRAKSKRFSAIRCVYFCNFTLSVSACLYFLPFFSKAVK